jgi:hypothetical protein
MREWRANKKALCANRGPKENYLLLVYHIGQVLYQGREKNGKELLRYYTS